MTKEQNYGSSSTMKHYFFLIIGLALSIILLLFLRGESFVLFRNWLRESSYWNQSQGFLQKTVPSKSAMAEPCSKYGRFMTVHYQGRLGNLMSEYATLLATAKLTGYTPYINNGMLSSLRGTFPNVSIKAIEISSECLKSLYRVDVCVVKKYDQLLTRDKFMKKYVYLPYYPSAYFLVDRIKEEILQEFKINQRYISTANGYLNQATKRGNHTLVGIHVRRTDYRVMLPLVKPDFFERAIHKIEKYLTDYQGTLPNVVYVVTSDDPKWCKDNFESFKRHIIYPSDFVLKSISSEKLKARDFDLAVASLCNHTIYDYGTFGFWGAYLAGGHTILAHKMQPNKQHRQVKHIKIAKLRGWEFIDAFQNVSYINKTH